MSERQLRAENADLREVVDAVGKLQVEMVRPANGRTLMLALTGTQDVRVIHDKARALVASWQSESEAALTREEHDDE